ncbi:MAG: hypothetical protein GXO07_06305 [Crenarchaeota archaeon]|nr:hypothetical protein [Thermoproteota archaeon]
MELPYTFLSIILTQTLIILNSTTTATVAKDPSAVYTITLFCPSQNVTKSNVVLGPFTAETLSLPCSPTEASLRATITFFLFYINEKTTITFTTATAEARAEPWGTVTLTFGNVSLTLDGLETMWAEAKLVLSFAELPPPPAAAVGALALGGWLKRRSSQKRSRPPSRRS